MTKYREIATGTVSNRGRVVDSASIPDIAAKQHNEMYNSLYYYDEEILEHFKIRKTVRNYRGSFYLDNIILDIDKGTNTAQFTLDLARSVANDAIEIGIPVENMEFYFSGTGYHITIPNVFKFQPSNHLPHIVKLVIATHFPACDNIYDGTRLIRTPNTINKKSNLYKIPLTFEEFNTCTVDEILQLASSPRTIKYDPLPEEELPDLSSLVNSILKEHTETPDLSTTTEVATCVQKMYNEGPIPGSRHHKMLRIASAWRRGGMTKQALYDALKMWAVNLEAYEVKRIVSDVYSKEYHPYSCEDSLMKKYCDNKCIFYKNKNFVTELIETADAEKSFSAFINSDYDKNSFDLKIMYGINNSYKFLPGEAIGIMADTKMGKSTIVQNWAVALKDLRVVYLTLENDLNLAYRRFIQIDKRMTKDEVIEHYRNNPDMPISDGIGHIKMLNVPPTMNDVKKIVAQHKPNLLIVDTLDSIDVPGVYDDTQKTLILANEIKALSNQMKMIVISVLHISKSAAVDFHGNQKALNVHSAKGSSSLAQKFDKILTLEGDRGGTQRFLISQASRDEQGINIALQVDWDTCVISPYNTIERKTENEPRTVRYSLDTPGTDSKGLELIRTT